MFSFFFFDVCAFNSASHAPVYELAQSFSTTRNVLSLTSPRLWVLRKSVTSGSVEEDNDHCYFPRKQYLSSKSMDKVSK